MSQVLFTKFLKLFPQSLTRTRAHWHTHSLAQRTHARTHILFARVLHLLLMLILGVSTSGADVLWCGGCNVIWNHAYKNDMKHKTVSSYVTKQEVTAWKATSILRDRQKQILLAQVSTCFETSWPLGITCGLNTNSCLSVTPHTSHFTSTTIFLQHH